MDMSHSPYVGPHSLYSEGLLRINNIYIYYIHIYYLYFYINIFI